MIFKPHHVKGEYMKTFKRVAVVSKDSELVDDISYQAKKRGYKPVKKKPDFVIACGGDGTLLISERMFPGIPKLMLKDSEHCASCHGYETPIDELLAKLTEGKYEIEEHQKLHASWMRGKRNLGEFICINDFIIRNQILTQALRFRIFIDEDEPLKKELIGDGAIICTSFGSTAYYQSITKNSFEEGLGIALNNCNVRERGIHTSRDKTITIEITRMPADFAVDNDPDIKIMEAGDTLVVNASAEKMRIIRVH